VTGRAVPREQTPDLAGLRVTDADLGLEDHLASLDPGDRAACLIKIGHAAR